LVPVTFETFEHEADIGIRGFGRTLEEAFGNAAIALYSVIIKIDAVIPSEKRTVAVTAPDREFLFIEWLNKLLSISDVERMVFSKFEVELSGMSLTGTAWGEPLDRVRHEPHVEVKGATYHMLKVGKQGTGYVAQCVVDV
jgi:SHS2 domain-containing protein